MTQEQGIAAETDSADDRRDAITINVNGDEREVAANHTVASLLAELGVHPGVVVVERNREILRRDGYGTTHVRHGDALELVHFVGGG